MKGILVRVVALVLVLQLLTLVSVKAQENRQLEAKLLAQSTGTQIGVGRIANEDDNVTSVEIKLTSQSSGTYIATLNTGGCGAAGAVRFVLNNVVNGHSYTLVNVGYFDIIDSEWQVVITRPGDSPSNYSACADKTRIYDNYDADLTPVAGSGVQGQAFVQHTQVGSQQTGVMVLVQPRERKFGALFVSGTCATPGTLRYKLNDVSDGSSDSVINAPVWDVAKGDWHIAVVAQGTSAPYLACGDGGPGGKGGMPGTDWPIFTNPANTGPAVGMPRTGSSLIDSTAALILIALGLIVIGSKLTRYQQG
ncbi:MAG TPA: hypothetical protein VM409_06430 [Chloroflexia bacterium]|nr:hypothetical protein [Chloroflexia bacterium]